MSKSEENNTDSIEAENLGPSNLMDRPFNPKDIDITSKTMSLDTIIKRLDFGEIDLDTEFQRHKDLWDFEKQSKLIESILIKFPLPAFYFDGSNNNDWLIVDGLQRMSSLKRFVIDDDLELTGLEFLYKLEGKKFSELSRSLQRQIEETQITAYIINPGTPIDVKFNIFRRINTGGLILTGQEIRHALNQGRPANFVKELADLNSFKKATQHSIKAERMLDREFTNRFLAFYLTSHQKYRPDIDSFLNESLVKLSELDEKKIQKCKNDFDSSMNLAYKVFGRYAFRKVPSLNERRRPINKALFEVWSVLFAKLTDSQREKIENKQTGKRLFQEFIELQNKNSEFFDSISNATGTKSRVIYRHECLINLLEKYVN